MSVLEDRYGLALSTASAEARDAYVDGVDRILSAAAGVEPTLERALRADPDFALAHAALARELFLRARASDARAAIDRATARVARASEREQAHVEILRRTLTGDAPGALELIRGHVQRHPRDALALSPACGVFGLIGFSGRGDREPEQLALLEPLATHYGDDWWFLSVHAFALLELGDWARGLERMERSLEQFPDSAHGAHTLAHALYEGGDDARAAQYLEAWLPAYPRDGLLHCHLWWHLCLLRIAEGRLDAAWDLYDAHCAPGVSTSPSINVLTDGASLLWRAELAGAPRSRERWTALRDYYQASFRRPIVFVDAHAALPYAALGDGDALDAYLDQVESLDAAGKLPAGSVAATLSRAYAAYARGDWAAAIAILEPALDQVVRIGGSRAQRDLITNTLLAAYTKDGRADAARALVKAELARKPTHPVAGLPAMD